MWAMLMCILLSEMPATGIVEQEIDCISIAHTIDSQGEWEDITFFWGYKEGVWLRLDHKYIEHREVYWQDGKWVLEWHDPMVNCYRIVKAKVWIESTELQNPISIENRKPWWAQRVEPGLKPPRN